MTVEGKIAATFTVRITLRVPDEVGTTELAVKATSKAVALGRGRQLDRQRLGDDVAQRAEADDLDAVEGATEVTTPATITTSAVCPECRQPTEIVVKLGPRLT